MGCSAKANVLLVGGGGTGGYVYNSGDFYGGGGSGYINYTTVHIPYSTLFEVLIGDGGVENSRSYYLGQTVKQSSMTGGTTAIADEFGSVISKAEVRNYHLVLSIALKQKL